MKEYSELQLLINDMVEQDQLYKPTSFWQQASLNIKNDFEQFGIEKFRSLKQSLYYFVPTYGYPGNNFPVELKEDILEILDRKYSEYKKPVAASKKFLDGESQALADFRVLLAADDTQKTPHLHDFSEDEFGDPIEQFEFQERKFSRSALNYLLGLAFLKKHIGDYEIKNVLEVGGGFGTLGEILFKSNINDLRYIDIDIPPTLFAAQEYLTKVAGIENVTKYPETRNLDQIPIDQLKKISTIPSWQIEKISGKIDLFVNFISFQEMEPHIVKNYLQHVLRLEPNWILLRNMKEGKQVKKKKTDIGVEEPILGDDYISFLEGYDLVERNVFPYGFKTVDNFHSELMLLKRK